MVGAANVDETGGARNDDDAAEDGIEELANLLVDPLQFSAFVAAGGGVANAACGGTPYRVSGTFGVFTVGGGAVVEDLLAVEPRLPKKLLLPPAWASIPSDANRSWCDGAGGF